jgi:chromosomal replication initiation ATPase DnaA
MAAGIWDQVLARVETKVNRHSFYTWFQPTALISDTGSTLFVRIPNPMYQEWLTKHYAVIISESLAEVQRPGVDVVFIARPSAAGSSYDDVFAEVGQALDRMRESGGSSASRPADSI